MAHPALANPRLLAMLEMMAGVSEQGLHNVLAGRGSYQDRQRVSDALATLRRQGHDIPDAPSAHAQLPSRRRQAVIR